MPHSPYKQTTNLGCIGVLNDDDEDSEESCTEHAYNESVGDLFGDVINFEMDDDDENDDKI